MINRLIQWNDGRRARKHLALAMLVRNTVLHMHVSGQLMDHRVPMGIQCGIPCEVTLEEALNLSASETTSNE